MENQIEINQGTNDQTQIEVKFEQETVWLSQEEIAALLEREEVQSLSISVTF